MKLHGQAGSTELFELFQLLANSQKTGVLVVKTANETRRVQFTPHGITLLFETETETHLLGNILVRRGRITRTQLEKTLELQKATQRMLGELLVQTGAAKAEDVNEALAFQLEEELFELLRWEGASFDFKEDVVEVQATPGPMTSRKYQSNPFFDVGAILMEAARRADEWKRIHGVLTSSKTVLIRRAQEWTDPGNIENPERARHIWDLLDGTRNLEDLMERSALSRFQVFESAYELHRAGLVKLISPEELLNQAEETLVSGKTEYGLGLLAKACEGLDKNPELQVQAGQLYFWAGRDEEARQMLDVALHELMERGQLEVALKFLLSLHQQYPDRSYPLERLVRLYREVPDFESAQPIATDLLSRYQEQHDHDKQHRLLKFLCEFPLKSEHSRLALAKLLTSFGEPLLASEQYETLGKLAQKSGRKKDAISHYRQALHLDPARSEAQRRLLRLTVLPRTRTRKILKRLIAAGILLTLTGGFAAGIHHEIKSRQDWDEVRRNVQPLVEQHRYDEARQICRDFIGRTMLTTALESAHDELKAIDAAENGYKSRCVQKDRLLWTTAVKTEGTGDYEAVVTSYEQVIEQAFQPSVAEKARERLTEVRDRRTRFEKLLDQAEQAESRQDYTGATRIYLEAASLEPAEWTRRQISLPVLVTSTPAGAEVWQDTRRLGNTPLLVRRHLDQDLNLTVRQSGYLPGKLTLSGKHTTDANIELLETRLPRWTRSLDGPVDVPVNVDESRLFVSSRAGEVTAIETATGRILWTRNLGGLRGSYLSQSVRQQQSLYMLLGDGRVMRLSASDGKDAWSRALRTLLTGTPLLSPSDDVVVTAAADGNLFALDTTRGDLRWNLTAGEHINWLLATDNGYLCVGPASVVFLARESASGGTKSWKQPLPVKVSAQPAVSVTQIYVPGEDGSLTILDIRTGRIVKTIPLSGRPLVSPVLSQPVLLVTDTDGNIRAFDRESGKTLWTRALAEPLSTGGTCNDTTFYVGTDRGGLVALDIHTGKVRWQAVLDGPVQSTPVVTGQLCLIATRTGTVYAMALK